MCATFCQLIWESEYTYVVVWRESTVHVIYECYLLVTVQQLSQSQSPIRRILVCFTMLHRMPRPTIILTLALSPHCSGPVKACR